MTVIADSSPLGFALGLWRRAMASAWAVLALYAAIYATIVVFRPPPAGVAILVVAELLVSAMVQGALMRLGLGQADPDPPRGGIGAFGLQWTAVETRVLLSRLLLMLVMILLLVAAVFCMALAGAVVMAVSRQTTPATDFFRTQAGATVLATGLVFAAAAIWLLTRLALSGPATVDRGEVQVFASWPMTSGARPWRLLFWCPALNVLVFVLGFALRAAEQAGVLQDATATLATLGYVLFLAFIETPIAAGISVNAYRQLKA